MDVELAGRDDEAHQDSHHAPALQRWQTMEASLLNGIRGDFWGQYQLLEQGPLQSLQLQVGRGRCRSAASSRTEHTRPASPRRYKNAPAFPRSRELLTIREPKHMLQTGIKAFPVTETFTFSLPLPPALPPVHRGCNKPPSLTPPPAGQERSWRHVTPLDTGVDRLLPEEPNRAPHKNPNQPGSLLGWV